MKNSRIDMIIKIINENCVENQEELVKLLAQNGVYITQATASRDIARLNIVKVKKDGKSCYAILDNNNINDDSVEILKNMIVKFNVAENQVLVKTENNRSKEIEKVLLNMNFDEIVGTLSNENTILIITKNNENAIMLSNKLYKIMNRKLV